MGRLGEVVLILALILPRPILRAETSPQITAVTDVRGNSLFGERDERQAQPTVPYSTGKVQIHFKVADEASDETVQYQSRLLGLEKSWSDWSSATFREFTSLGEHDYRFEVRARDARGEVSKITSYEFEVLPPWYRTLGMYLIYSVVALTAFAGFIGWRVRDYWATISKLRHEIDARQEAQLKSQQLQTQLVQAKKLESLGTLAAGVAHDFNNSLTAIAGLAGLAAERLESGSREAEYVELILEATKQAASTTKGLLTFSRKEASRKQKRDLVKLVDESVNFFRRVLPTHISLQWQSPPHPLYANIDDSQIKQALMNLVLNARDAMPSGGSIRIHLEPSVATDSTGADSLTLRIADSGEGMSQEVQERVFDPFFTTKSRGLGTGLGMSIVHGIIEEHQGSIELESTLGVGTTWIISLPHGSSESTTVVDARNAQEDTTASISELETASES